MAFTTQYPDTPMGALMRAAGLRWVDVASRSGVSETALRTLARSDARIDSRTRWETRLRVAAALGAAPAELWPILAVRPRRGLLWERGIFTATGRGPTGSSAVARSGRSGG